MLNVLKMELLKNNQRGVADHGWLKSKHSFSFANYYNPFQMGFSDLRVINDDLIAAGKGFGTHPHKDMEIFSYVTEGSLAHKDSMGNVETIESGEVQLMSAGTGVQHSEFNPSNSERTHLFQIWILPSSKGGTPGYQQIKFLDADKKGVLKLIISPNGDNNSLKIKQNVNIYAGLFNDNEEYYFHMNPKRSYYAHVIKGNISLNEIQLSEGDAIKIFEGDGDLMFHQGNNAEILFFDLNKH